MSKNNKVKTTLRVGDIVKCEGKTGFVNTIRSWYLIGHHISVTFKGSQIGSIVLAKDCKLVTKREDVKKWWNLIDNSK